LDLQIPAIFPRGGIVHSLKTGTVHAMAKAMAAALSDTHTFQGMKTVKPTTLLGDCIVLDVDKLYTIVSTRLRYAAILYDNGASSTEENSEGEVGQVNNA
jgi:hypothetical protein